MPPIIKLPSNYAQFETMIKTIGNSRADLECFLTQLCYRYLRARFILIVNLRRGFLRFPSLTALISAASLFIEEGKNERNIIIDKI